MKTPERRVELDLYQSRTQGVLSKVTGEQCDCNAVVNTKRMQNYDGPDYKTCQNCNGEGVIDNGLHREKPLCPICQGNMALGVDPYENKAYPGTADKIAVLAARYAEGLPLWSEHDVSVDFSDVGRLLQLN